MIRSVISRQHRCLWEHGELSWGIKEAARKTSWSRLDQGLENNKESSRQRWKRKERL